jgi:hypothetical protein
MYFIILTTALTLHGNGVTNIKTSRDAAAALRPLAGAFAATLFTAGIVGVGLVSIPTLITSAADAIAETFRCKDGLNEKFKALIRRVSLESGKRSSPQPEEKKIPRVRTCRHGVRLKVDYENMKLRFT